MKVLCENNIRSLSFNNIIQNIQHKYSIGVINDVKNTAKSLNDFQPDLLVLRAENIDSVVKAYCHKNNTKLISVGEEEKGDITFNQATERPLPNLKIIDFKENVDKTDTSVFINHPEFTFLANFLAKNYNVKIYGNVKINHPQYLGEITDVDFYEILNRSKFSVVFSPVNIYDSVLLDTYPIAYHPNQIESCKTFNNLISLADCMDNILEDKSDIVTLKNQILRDNSTTFTISVLERLGFYEEAGEFRQDLEEIQK
jgi:hypothetical protein